MLNNFPTISPCVDSKLLAEEISSLFVGSEKILDETLNVVDVE
jgi:hypothetical protein